MDFASPCMRTRHPFLAHLPPKLPSPGPPPPQVAACDAAAPSWQFLRSAWAQLQAQGRAAAGEEGAQLLWVISHAASRFPPEDAAALAKELLQVGAHLCLCALPMCCRVCSSWPRWAGRLAQDKRRWETGACEGAAARGGVARLWWASLQTLEGACRTPGRPCVAWLVHSA